MSKCILNIIVNYDNFLQDLTDNKDGIMATKSYLFDLKQKINLFKN